MTDKIAVYLDEQECFLFKLFQENYTLVAHILGTMNSLKLNGLTNCNVSMDFDAQGLIQHTAVTKHYKLNI